MRARAGDGPRVDRKSTRLNSSHRTISYAVFGLKKKRDVAPGDGRLDRIGALEGVPGLDVGHVPKHVVVEQDAVAAEQVARLGEDASFFFNDTPTTEIYTLSLHDALPISTATTGPKGAITTARPPYTTITASGADRKSTRLNSSHRTISYAVFCLKKKNNNDEHSTSKTKKNKYENKTA